MFVEAFELEASDLVTAARALSSRSRLCWLDGDTTHAAGRFSFLACDPVQVINACFNDHDPLRALDALQCNERDGHKQQAIVNEFAIGRLPRWVGYVAYDACWSRPEVGSPRHARPDQSVLWFARYDAWLVFDRVTQQAHLVGDNRPAIARLRDKLNTRAAPLHAVAGTLQQGDEALHRHAINAALEQIAAGNLYQVNLARSFHATLHGDPLALYLAMRTQGDVPFGAYIDAGDQQVLSRTMERFLHWDRTTRSLQTRPIKGTIARRGDNDEKEADTLRNDQKERAEHTMIVDLMRNDLGRVAEVGSVRPTETLCVEPYAGLSHLVSTVECTTRPEVTLGSIFEATFPPGSVTGTPKLAAIQQIENLEAEPRGLYTGTIGYVDQAGGCNFAVAIRTAVVHDGIVRYYAGGGIVYGSEPAREVDETTLKARVFTDALGALKATAQVDNRL